MTRKKANSVWVVEYEYRSKWKPCAERTLPQKSFANYLLMRKKLANPTMNSALRRIILAEAVEAIKNRRVR